MSKKKAAHKEDGFNVEVYKCGPKDRKPGMWTFRLNGKDTHWYCTHEEGLQKVINRLVSGVPAGSVIVPPVKGRGKPMNAAEAEISGMDSWDKLPTRAERVEAFLNRGRLKDGVLQPAQTESEA